MGKYETDSSYFEQDCTEYNLRLLHAFGDKSDFNKYLAAVLSLQHICTHSSLGAIKQDLFIEISSPFKNYRELPLSITFIIHMNFTYIQYLQVCTTHGYLNILANRFT
jgi:hypothetical protein